jgi:heat shock protein HslJ
MKCWITVLLVFVSAAAILSGCTGQQPAATPAPTATVTATPVPPTDLSSAVPPDLAGNWTLTTLGIQGGTAVISPVAEITLWFSPDSTLSGYDGCNNYYATVHLTGITTPQGSGMTLGPVGRSTKYCAGLADQERQYWDILGQTSEYNVDHTQLTLTATTGNVLIYQRPATLVTPQSRGY